MNALIFKLITNLVDVSMPLFLRTRLRTDLNRVLVLIVVTEERIAIELVLEAHREGLVLIWEVNEHILLAILGQLHEVLLQLLRLRLLDDLRNDDHGDLEFLLLHVHRVVLELDDTQSFECGVAWAWQFDTRKYLGCEGLSAHIFIISVQCEFREVCLQT